MRNELPTTGIHRGFMKRDLDLMREILMQVEASEGPVYPPWLPDRGREELQLIGHQVMLLTDAGYIEADYTPPETIGTIFRITNRGHDYLDSVRDPKVWKETKAKLEKVGGGGPLEFVKDIAAKTIGGANQVFFGRVGTLRTCARRPKPISR